MKVVRVPAKTNPTYVLSRLTIGDQRYRERDVAEKYVNFTEKAVPKAITMGKKIVSFTKRPSDVTSSTMFFSKIIHLVC